MVHGGIEGKRGGGESGRGLTSWGLMDLHLGSCSQKWGMN